MTLYSIAERGALVPVECFYCHARQKSSLGNPNCQNNYITISILLSTYKGIGIKIKIKFRTLLKNEYTVFTVIQS